MHTYKANTIAKQDMLKKIKVGDVVIGLTTPLMVTAISPAGSTPRASYLMSTSSQKPIQWSTGFILACGAS